MAKPSLVFVAFTVLSSLALVYYVFDGSTFSYHPAAMLFAFVGLSSNAVHFMNTTHKRSLHMWLQIAAAITVFGGMYAIYTVKNTYGKPHFWTLEASWHAWFGAFSAISLIFGAFGALFTVGPLAFAKVDNAARAQHAVFGAVVLLAFAGTILSGWAKVYGYDIKFAVVSLVLGYIAYVALVGRLLRAVGVGGGAGAAVASNKSQ